MRRTFFLSSLISFIVGLAEIILALRILFRLFAANPAAPFAHWIYATSDTLLEPFRGIFPSTVIARSHVLDFTALFSLLVYAMFGSLLVYIANWLENAAARPTVTSEPVTTVRTKRKL